MGTIIGVAIPPDLCLHHACCVDACPEVFQISNEVTFAEVKPDAQSFFVTHDGAIREAAAACPIGIISIIEAPDLKT